MECLLCAKRFPRLTLQREMSASNILRSVHFLAGEGFNMVSMTVELRNVEGTEAAMGWAGDHTIVVDRPPGKAGGEDSASMGRSCSRWQSEGVSATTCGMSRTTWGSS